MHYPIPDHVLDRFRILAARETLGTISTEEIVHAADQTLTEGIYHDALLAILDGNPQTHAVATPQLKRICDDFLIPMGDVAWSMQCLVRHFISRMALPNSDPDSELASLIRAVGPAAWERICKNQRALRLNRILFLEMQTNYYGQLHDVSEDEMRSAREECLSLQVELRNAAAEWMTRYGSLGGGY